MHLRSRRARLLVAASTLLVPAAVLATAQPALAAPTGTVSVQGTLPQWLSKSAAGTRSLQKASPASASKKLTIRVYLAPKGGEAGLQQAVAAVSDPSSPSYAHYLTTDQYRSTYRPTSSSAKQVSRWLTANHLKVTGTEAQRRYVTARGSVARLNHAFGITLTNLKHDGKSVIAPTSAARVPASLASSVLTVDGLDTTKVAMTHRSSPKVDPPVAFQNARPCSRYFGQLDATYQAGFTKKLPKFRGVTLPYVPCGYTGVQLRSAYTPAGNTLDGSGVTVAITDAYRWQYIARDADQYASTNGDGSYAPGQLTENVPASYNSADQCDPSGWSGEETLDVEAVHAMAPAAKIRYYASSSCFDSDFLSTLSRVVDENVAKVVSNSWADSESAETSSAIVAYEQIFMQGALQGQTFTFSSGDDGDEAAATGLKQANYPSSDPYVTALGGTSTGIDGDGKRSFDTGWGTVKDNLTAAGSWSSIGFTSGAGGGYSGLFERPAYQRGVVPASDAPGRAVPDVAMDADPNTGFLVGQTQKFSDGTVRYGEYRIGGTSLASPLFAGMTALTIQQNGGRGFGQLNPLLYKNTKVADDVVAQPSRIGVVRADYTDPASSASSVVYSVREFGQDSSLDQRKGWDPVTGLGVPNAGFLKLTTPAT